MTENICAACDAISKLEALCTAIDTAVKCQGQLLHLAKRNFDDSLTMEALIGSVEHFHNILFDRTNDLSALIGEIEEKGCA